MGRPHGRRRQSRTDHHQTSRKRLGPNHEGSLMNELAGYLHTALLREHAKPNGHAPPMADDDPPHGRSASLSLIDWATAFNRPPVDAIVEGLVFPGRWTALVAPAKLGKSTLGLHIAHTLARGIDPFQGSPQTAVDILYLDGEMGEADILERLTALDLTPCDLARLHYTDLFPKGDTIQGGAAIVSTAINLGAQVVVLDGLNAFATGAEKDDSPWRNLFE